MMPNRLEKMGIDSESRDLSICEVSAPTDQNSSSYDQFKFKLKNVKKKVKFIIFLKIMVEKMVQGLQKMDKKMQVDCK